MKRVQLIRHDTAGANSFTGRSGEITIDTTKNTVRVHNGVTVGGIETAQASQLAAKAPKADPVFTGVMSLVAVKTGRIDKTSAATVDIDFDAGPNQQINPLSTNVTFTTSNLAAASGEVKFVDMRIVCDATLRTLTFPATWVWMTNIPTGVLASKTGFLSLRCYGTTDATIIAAWASTL